MFDLLAGMSGHANAFDLAQFIRIIEVTSSGKGYIDTLYRHRYSYQVGFFFLRNCQFNDFGTCCFCEFAV